MAKKAWSSDKSKVKYSIYVNPLLWKKWRELGGHVDDLCQTAETYIGKYIERKEKEVK